MTIDPRSYSDAEIEAAVRVVVKGSHTTSEAKAKIQSLFSSEPLVWVIEKGEFQFGVLFKLYPNATHHSIICDR